MHGLYGALWLDRYRIGQSDSQGRDLGVENAKATWGKELAGFGDHPQMIAWALEQLRHQPLPPTLPEFMAFCRQAPRPERPSLPEPRIDPEKASMRAREAREKAMRAMGREPGHGWAIRILQDIADGVVLPRISEQFAIEALANLGRLDEVPQAYTKLQRAPWRAAMA